jgi:hypothetical protein
MLQGEPIDGVWEAESLVDEVGRRQDSAYAYLRPVMGTDGVPSLHHQMDNPVLVMRSICTKPCLEPKHVTPVAGPDGRSQHGAHKMVFASSLL